MNILAELRSRFLPAIAALGADPAPLLEMIRPAQDARFGDYQANFAMPLGKALGRPPREIAAEVIGSATLDDVCDKIDVAGPGFINLRLRDEWLAGLLDLAAGNERLGVVPAAAPRTFVIDYSSPNVAKPMHVGHIRSTVIGAALERTLRLLGHRVISDNHLGDWGTQFGMILYGYRHFGDPDACRERPVEELSRIYRLVRRLMDYFDACEALPTVRARLAEQEAALAEQRQQAAASADPTAAKRAEKAAKRLQSQRREAEEEIAAAQSLIAAVEEDEQLRELAKAHPDIRQAVLDETARLHAGDPELRRLWETFLPACRQEIQRIYDRLGVRFDVELGESFYQDQLEAVVESLQQRGLARESDGALCLFLPEFDAPMIVRKKDGAFLYATTDLATIEYRLRTWRPNAILYVVDFRQGEHFAKLFAAARLWLGEALANVELTHVKFGTVLGDDGRPFKTRAGDTVGLEGLLDEAVRRAYEIVSQNDDAKPDGPELSAEERRRIAETVGIAAIKYADLSQNRESDYVFSYDKMLAMNGNTATYMQYAYARVRNIFARGGVDPAAVWEAEAAVSLAHPAERALALELLRLPEALDLVVADYRPSQLTTYLYELAGKYTAFYENCPVLKADSSTLRTSRLRLCDLTARTLRLGLDLLGIEVVDKM